MLRAYYRQDPAEGWLKPLLIVWHSRTGAARQMAEAAADGAAAAAAELAPRPVSRSRSSAPPTPAWTICWPAAVSCSAPENLASLSGEMKEFFDRCYYGALDRIQGLPYACAISAGSDGAGAARQTERICRLAPAAAAPALIVNLGAQTPAQIAAPRPCRRLIWSAARNWADCWPD